MDQREYTADVEWSALSTRSRCRTVARAATRIVDSAQRLTELCASDQRTDAVETLASELLPLCSALKYIGQRGAKVLRTRRCGARGRPAWLWGVQSVVRRDPRGKVLILGTWNYPLLLSGVQIAQALAAGNQVLVKPAIGCEDATKELVACFYQAGVPPDQLVQLDSSTETAIRTMDEGVDLIVLTGAASTGRKVLARAAESLTPTIMELSGCDAVVVTPSADLTRTVNAIDFGLNFNGGATCISPRRLIVEEGRADQLIGALKEKWMSVPQATVHPVARATAADTVENALSSGATDCLGRFDADLLRSEGKVYPVLLDGVAADDPIASADLFAPITSVIRVPRIADAVEVVNGCRYRLSASVFGDREARDIAAQLAVGSITVNDILAPTADPRLPFGGRGDSGFGVTRGEEGLLAMTVPTVISVRRGRFLPHLDQRKASDEEALVGMLKLLHAGSLATRLAGLRQIARAGKNS